MTTPADDSVAVDARDVQLDLGRSAGEVVRFFLPSLTVAAHEHVALVGPSGCGKSTLLQLVSGLLTPDSGTLRVLGEDIARLSPARRDSFRGRNIGIVYQTFHLLEGLTALENVKLGLTFGRAVERSKRAQAAHEALETVGLANRLRVPVDRLSVGERQRVAIARAIVNHPRLLLADEPTGSLDPANGQVVLDLLVKTARDRGCALMLVTNDLDIAASLPRQIDCHGLVTTAHAEVPA